MQRCAQMHEVATIGRLFPSSSSDKVYKVTAFRPNQFPFCNCPAYIFSRSKKAKAEGVHQNSIPGECKHTKTMFASTCQWEQKTTAERRFDDTCPKCGGPVIDTDEVVYEVDERAQIEDLRALAADLLGVEAPAPLPPALVEYTVRITETRVHEFTFTATSDDDARDHVQTLPDIIDAPECKVIKTDLALLTLGPTEATAPVPEPPAPKKRASRKAPAAPRSNGRSAKDAAAALLAERK